MKTRRKKDVIRTHLIIYLYLVDRAAFSYKWDSLSSFLYFRHFHIWKIMKIALIHYIYFTFQFARHLLLCGANYVHVYSLGQGQLRCWLFPGNQSRYIFWKKKFDDVWDCLVSSGNTFHERLRGGKSEKNGVKASEKATWQTFTWEFWVFHTDCENCCCSLLLTRLVSDLNLKFSTIVSPSREQQLWWIDFQFTLAALSSPSRLVLTNFLCGVAGGKQTKTNENIINEIFIRSSRARERNTTIAIQCWFFLATQSKPHSVLWYWSILMVRMMNARSCRCCSWNNTIFIIFQFKMMRWQQLWRSVSVKLSSWLRNKRKRAEREFSCVIIPSSSHHTVTGAQQTEWKGGERKRKENILAKPFFPFR